jgi:quinol monooxygenase YgiN
MIMTSLTFTLKAGSAEALADVYRRHHILEAAMSVEGCLRLALVDGPPGSSQVSVVGFWEDRAAYQRWLDHPYRDTAEDEFDALMDTDWEPSAAAEIGSVILSTPSQEGWA